MARDAFLQLKPELPAGSLPALKIDGEYFAQSNALLAYAARLAQLTPADPLDALVRLCALSVWLPTRSLRARISLVWAPR